MAINNKAIAAVTCGLSLAMTLGGPLSAIPAYAATVNINRDQAGQTVSDRTFNAYKIATYETDADGGKVYTFVNDDVRNAVRSTLESMNVDLNGVTTDVSLSGKIAGLNAGKRAEFASSLVNALKTTSVQPTSVNGQASQLDDNSYYVLDETTATESVVKALPFLLETSTGVKDIKLKSSQPNIDKSITSAGKRDDKYDDTAIGSEVDFQLNGMKVPVTYGYDTYTYTITDQMSSGLTLSKKQLEDMTVKIGDNVIPAGPNADGDTAYTVWAEDGGEMKPIDELPDGWSAKSAKFEIRFDSKYFIGETTEGGYTQNPVAGTAITVDFKGTLNEDAKVASPEQNKTFLTYSNTPGSTTNTSEHKVYVYTFGVEVQKSFTDDKNLFSMVEFGIMGTNGTIYVKGEKGVYTVCKEDTEGAVDASAGLKLDEKGHFQIKGLDAGTYTVKEAKTPDGYTPNGEQTIVVNPDYGTDGASGKAGNTIKLQNDSDNNGYVDGAIVNRPSTFQLPETGDAGMFLLPAAGMGIMGVVLIVAAKKKMDKTDE